VVLVLGSAHENASFLRSFPHYRVGGFMSHSKWILASVLVLLISNQAPAQQQPITTTGMSHKYRAVLTPVGAAGGFAGGVLIGLATFDDARYADRKVWTTAILGGAGGAVGGYFLGRALDKRRDRAKAQSTPRTVQVSPVVAEHAKGVQFSIWF
jgi:hypothetical protein